MPLRTADLSRPPALGSAASLGWGRVGAGSTMVLRPSVMPRLMGLDSATAARAGWAVQMLGVRDLALGVGTLVALRRDRRAARTWVALGAVCDAVDALALGGAVLRGRISRPGAAAGIGVAVLAVASGVAALQEDEADI